MKNPESPNRPQEGHLVIISTKIAATVLTATLGTGAAAVATVPDKAPSTVSSTSPAYRGYVHFEGPSVNITPKEGTGGLLLRDEAGVTKGAMGAADTGTILGCHPTDPELVWVVQTSTGTRSGGWGVSAGYVRHQYADVEGLFPCGG